MTATQSPTTAGTLFALQVTYPGGPYWYVLDLTREYGKQVVGTSDHYPDLPVIDMADVNEAFDDDAGLDLDRAIDYFLASLEQ